MVVRYDFAFDRRFRPLLALGGIRPATCEVVVTDRLLDVRFGPFRLQTPRDNVREVGVSGPYLPIKAIGPRGSRLDGGVTFGTNADRGVCVRFHEPVGALFGRHRLRHPGMTVTVADIHGLVDTLTP